MSILCSKISLFLCV